MVPPQERQRTSPRTNLRRASALLRLSGLRGHAKAEEYGAGEGQSITLQVNRKPFKRGAARSVVAGSSAGAAARAEETDMATAAAGPMAAAARGAAGSAAAAKGSAAAAWAS
eukprot:scaffold40940_cov54-Phaeocystis_antarctica.AAC.2